MGQDFYIGVLHEGMAMVLEEWLKRLEKHDVVERLSKLEVVVGMCELQGSPEKPDDRAMQTAANNNKDGACKTPKRAEIDDSAIASKMEQMQSRVHSLELRSREMQDVLMTLSQRSLQQPSGSSQKEDRQGTEDLRDRIS